MVQTTIQGPSERFQRIVRILRNLASVCGVDLLRKNYRLNWVTYTLFVAIAIYFAFGFLTIYRNFHNDWTILLRASVTMGSGLQGVSKIIAYIPNRDIIVDLHKTLSVTYSTYEKLGEKYFKALEMGVERSKRGLICLTLFFVIGYAGLVTVPYVWLLSTGERFLVLEFYLPGLDIDTDFGYYVTLVLQTIMVVCFSFGLFGGDSVGTLYLLQSFMFSHVFAAKIEYFNDMIADPDNNKKPCVTKALNDIAEWVQIYSDYTIKCNKLFYYAITAQTISAFGSTVISIYLIIAGGYPGAYTYVVISFCCLYLYCILGTETELSNKKFESEVYCINWYNLTASQQKIVLQILVITQSPKTLDIAGVMPLSVSTALRLTKTVYSITMFMIQFFME